MSFPNKNRRESILKVVLCRTKKKLPPSRERQFLSNNNEARGDYYNTQEPPYWRHQ